MSLFISNMIINVVKPDLVIGMIEQNAFEK